MWNRKRFRMLYGLLLTACFCWSGWMAFAQGKTDGNQKPKDNPHRDRVAAAEQELAAAIAERAKTDPQFKAYVDKVDKHKKDVDEFVKSKKGGKK
jgi:hypothetical protein